MGSPAVEAETSRAAVGMEVTGTEVSRTLEYFAGTSTSVEASWPQGGKRFPWIPDLACCASAQDQRWGEGTLISGGPLMTSFSADRLHCLGSPWAFWV